jgi:hypothetical protein
LFFKYASNLGASSSKNPAFAIPQDKNPRRLASDFMNAVFIDL